ncbi:hypothetical protein FHL15_004123 [Xylaria flabelliformis]|uniref:WSC domain-containing protein n=1 Tax=Xylaria flabelliformis TaxID=2512241 RepID=A0A553I493_9PEZI|nr:hypothetical protein FHL15_004123 [Xylaria flabelliformis]
MMMYYSTSSLFQALLLAIALRLAACSFSLDTVVTDWWYYVHNHLADTTSAACLAAYAAPIDCDKTLLGLVSSNSPNFNPGPDDLERTCVPSCADSLDAWVQNLKKVCNQKGDGALVHGNSLPYPEVPVAVVGEVFQYEHAFACSKNISGWCYFNYPSSSEWARTDFTCTNECASQFFANAHDLPGSQYWFRVYELEDRSDWWKTQWTEGYEHLLECRNGTAETTSFPDFPDETPTTTTMDSAVTETTNPFTFTDDSDTSTSTSTHSSTSASSTVPPTLASSTPTPTPTGNAGGRLRTPAVFRVLAWI